MSDLSGTGNGSSWEYPNLNILSLSTTKSVIAGNPAATLTKLISTTKNLNLAPNMNVGLGYDGQNKVQVVDFSNEPNLLIVGVPGCGKSNLVHTILLNLLFQNTPSELKLIIIDPSNVELKSYDDIPHLLAPVINEAENAISALKWAVVEAERRIKLLSQVRKRNIREYNITRKDDRIPDIFIIIDGLEQLLPYSDNIGAYTLMLVQRSRIVGIHILITSSIVSSDAMIRNLRSLITNNIAFKLMSGSESHLILDSRGAEELTNRGDMLLRTNLIKLPALLHSVLISSEQINNVTGYFHGLGSQNYNYEVYS
jgi:DNA segregation ATPase FtsK/SpoIIIE, S-DNA-T family